MKGHCLLHRGASLFSTLLIILTHWVFGIRECGTESRARELIGPRKSQAERFAGPPPAICCTHSSCSRISVLPFPVSLLDGALSYLELNSAGKKGAWSGGFERLST